MKAVAMSLDLVFAILILTFAIITITAYGNSYFHAPSREPQDIAVTFNEMGVLWTNSATIKHTLDALGLDANVVVKCYTYVGDSWELVNVTSVYELHTNNLYSYQTVFYHNGELCTVNVGVNQ